LPTEGSSGGSSHGIDARDGLGDAAPQRIGAAPGRGIAAIAIGHLGRVLQAVQAHALRRAAQARALVHQQVLGHRPAVVLLADQGRDGHAHVVEEHLVQLVVARQAGNGPDGDARQVQVETQEADALLRLALDAGAHQAEDAVGEMRVRGPDLGAVDDVVIAIAHRAALQRGQV
jgi:hypothetical protein